MDLNSPGVSILNLFMTRMTEMTIHNHFAALVVDELLSNVAVVKMIKSGLISEIDF